MLNFNLKMALESKRMDRFSICAYELKENTKVSFPLSPRMITNCPLFGKRGFPYEKPDPLFKK